MKVDRNEITISEEESKICKLDGKRFDSSRKMLVHVKKTYQKIKSFENYIVIAYYNNKRPRCLKTGKELTFKGHKLGPWFKNYTKNCFPRKKHTEETKQKIKENTKKSIRKKYGVDNVFETKWCKEKIKKTNLKKYGTENPMQSNKIKDNFDFTKSPETWKKTKKTNLKRYNTEIMYGSEYFLGKSKKTCLEKYGYEYASQNPEIKKKSIKTFWDTIKQNGYPAISKTSSYEIDFREKLKKANIKFQSPYIIDGRKYDFYIPVLDLVIEIDGEAYHKDILENLTFQTINVSINDKRKDDICLKQNKKLKRLRYDKKKFVFKTIEELCNVVNEFEYDRSYNINYDQRICHKEYFEKYKEIKGKDKLQNYVPLLLKFVRQFQFEFPNIPTNESLQGVTAAVENYSTKNLVYNVSTKTFRNNCSNIGTSYLKSKFKSYWKSHFKGHKHSPVDIWKDDKKMILLIKYRIGCNNSNDVYDFSIKEIIKGMSASRMTVSFFKPVLASAIYHQLLKNIKKPVVIDPCCGFGGRLIGFKCKYPKGTYIGCEPNIETYNELLQLKKDGNFDDVEIYNCKWEDFVLPKKYDLIFTSIPYFDLETYSNSVEYDSFNDWKHQFIGKFAGKRNCYINMNVKCCNDLNFSDKIYYYISQQKSHFSNIPNKEVICKLD